MPIRSASFAVSTLREQGGSWGIGVVCFVARSRQDRNVAKEIHAVEKTIVDGVVAELIRIRFDEMVAKAIRGK